MGCVICSPLPAYSIQVFTSSFSFKFFQVSDGFKSTLPYKVGGTRLERSATPRVCLFPKMTKFPTGVGGLQICSPFAFLFSIATSGNGKELSDNFVPNCPEIWGEVGQSIFGSVAVNGKLRPMGTSEDDPKFGASVVAPVQISRKVQKSPTKKGGEHHT